MTDSPVQHEQYIHGCYVKTSYDDDAVVMKVRVYSEDKEPYNAIKIVQNPTRAVYITKPEYRSHDRKKESEDLNKVDKIVVKNATMAKEIYNQLNPGKGQFVRYVSLKDVNKDPFVYGTDVSIETLIKHRLNVRFKKDYKNKVLPYTTGFYDIETDIKTGKMICATVTHENKIYTAVLEEMMFYEDDNGVKHKAEISDLMEMFSTIFPTYLDSLKPEINPLLEGYEFTPHFKVCKTPAEMVMWLWQCIEKNKTDFLGIWNIVFDMPKTLLALTDEGIDPADVMCSKDVPRKFRKCEFVIDEKKVDHPAKKWHWMYVTGHTQPLDSMCLYSHLRTVKGKESYRLEDILKKEIGAGKLYIKDDKMPDDASTTDWHRYMQAHRPLVYVIYNQVDCVSLGIVERKNRDITQMVALSKDTTYNAYPRQTKKTANDLHFYCLEKLNKVMASTPKTAYTEFDERITLAGGAVLMPERASGCGAHLLMDRPSVETMIHPYVADVDLSSSYPTICAAANISKDTKTSTMLSISGGDLNHARHYCAQMSAVRENAVANGHDYFGLPNYTELISILKTEQLLP